MQLDGAREAVLCVDDTAADEDEMETDEASTDVAMVSEMVAT